MQTVLRIMVLVMLAVSYALPGFFEKPTMPEPPQVKAHEDYACIFARGRSRRQGRRQMRQESRAFRVGYGC